MRTGELRHRIIIQEESFLKTPGTGEKISSWTDVCTVWAAVEPVSGREYFLSLETHSEQVVRVRIRYRAGITSDMRVIFDENAMYVQSVINPENRNRELELMCIKNLPVGPGE